MKEQDPFGKCKNTGRAEAREPRGPAGAQQSGATGQEQRLDPIGDGKPEREEGISTTAYRISSSVRSELRDN